MEVLSSRAAGACEAEQTLRARVRESDWEVLLHLARTGANDRPVNPLSDERR